MEGERPGVKYRFQSYGARKADKDAENKPEENGAVHLSESTQSSSSSVECLVCVPEEETAANAVDEPCLVTADSTPLPSPTTFEYREAADRSTTSDVPELDESDTSSGTEIDFDADEFRDSDIDQDTQTIRDQEYAKRLQEALDKNLTPAEEPEIEPEISLNPELLELRKLEEELNAKDLQIRDDYMMALRLSEGEGEWDRQGEYGVQADTQETRAGCLCQCWTCQPDRKW